MQLTMFDALWPTVPAGSADLAREYAARWGWQFLRFEERPGLFGPTPRAIFADSHGEEHDRTVDDLRA